MTMSATLADSRADRQADEVAVRAVIDQLAERWNQGDGAGYGALFADDADYIVFDGAHLRGRAAIAESHQRLFDAFLKGSTLDGQVTDLRFLAPDVAVAHGVGAVRLRWQATAPAGRQSTQTYVAVKQADGWRLAAFHNTRIQRPNPLRALLMRLVQR